MSQISGLPVNRRRVLQAGCLGTGLAAAGGLSLSDLLQRRAMAGEAAHRPGFGKAKACILLFMWGGPSHIDTLDPKPDAPAEVRGEFQSVATALPGVRISEHFKLLPGLMDKVSLIRSLGHSDPAHLSSAHAAVTGHLAPKIVSDDDPPSPLDTPHMGAVVSRFKATSGALPGSVIMPWKVFHPAAPGGQAPGQHGGWLGQQYDPFVVGGDPSQSAWSVPELSLLDGISVPRLQQRQHLLSNLDGVRRSLQDQADRSDILTQFQRQAFDMLGSPAARDAFDLSQEPAEVRARYGMNLHGQLVLLSRRLIERGVPLVTVNWHNDGRTFWDTHGNNFNRLKNDLIPPADLALSALLSDLEDRGLLDQTVVAWVGEFGRRPQITAANAGREHWPWCYSGLLAGGGIRPGFVHGASDRQGGRPIDGAVSPRDLIATLYQALGIDYEQQLPDRVQRPVRFCDGEPIWPLFA